MKKSALGLLILFLGLFGSVSFAENDFTKALRTCSNYSRQGDIPYEHIYYTVTITLEKSRNKCIYKEKISKDGGYQMLTCGFEMSSLEDIANNMDKFTTAYQKQVEKNRIFEAKLTTNAYVFDNYLANPKICQITTSSSKSK